MKLLGRLFASHVGLAAAGTVLTASCALISFDRYVVESNRADLAARTTAIAATAADWLEIGDRRHAELLAERHGAQEDIWIRILAADGSLIATSSPDDDAKVVDWRSVRGVAAALSGRPEAGIAPGVGSSDDRLYEARPLARNGRPLGVIRVSRTLAGLREQERKAIITIMAAALAVMGAAALASYYLARRLASPIRRMRDFAVHIGDRRFERLLPAKTDDELGELARSLNVMSDRLATHEEERRTFLARASHELRTPVTNVQASLEALEEGAVDDPQLRSQFLRTALRETHRMAALVRELLDLGQLEAGVSSVDERPVDVQRLVHAAVQALAPRFQIAEVKTSLVVKDVPPIVGDPDRLQRALINVLDNALRYSSPGRTVSVHLDADDAEVTISIADQGSGFSAADLPRIFEQFYTGLDAGGGRGTGLGLAIARRIIDGHQGSIAAANASHGGAVVTIRLPLRRSALCGNG